MYTSKYMYKECNLRSICNYKTSRRKRFSSLWISSIAYNSFMEKSRASPQFSPFVFPLALLTELACIYSRNIHLSLFLPLPVVDKKPWKNYFYLYQQFNKIRLTCTTCNFQSRLFRKYCLVQGTQYNKQICPKHTSTCIHTEFITNSQSNNLQDAS